MKTSSSSSGGFWKGWLVFISATILVIGFPYVRNQVNWIEAYTTGYQIPFLPSVASERVEAPLAQVDTAILKDTLVTLQVDTAYLDSLDRANYLDSIDAEAAKGLTSFFSSLSQLESDSNKKVTILWFGDSMIEGDMITQDVRDSLQRRFGGAGIGHVPITSVVNYFRNTIRHDFSENWSNFNLVNGEKPHLPLNWNGEYFTAAHDSDAAVQTSDSLFLSYRGSGAFEGTRYLPNATLLYGRRKKDSLYHDSINTVTFKSTTYPLTDTNKVNRLKLSKQTLYRVEPTFELKPDQPLFGMHFHSGSGIELSNISSRGNSGMILSAVPAAIFKGMSGDQPPSLIVLQYGVNASSLGVTQYDWYQRAMKRVVRYLQRVYPTTSIVVVSLADRCAKINGTMQTDSSVFAMNKVLMDVALENEVAYFDLFNKMGGANSMKEWAEGEPSLANKDYTHFNFRGSRKVANYFIEFLTEQYSAFKKEEKQHD